MTLSLDAYRQNNVLLLDGGMGQELRRRCSNEPTSLWSSQALVEQPEVVQQVHEDYIRAGAKVITTNSYSTVRHRLEEHAGLGERFTELMNLSGKLATQARDAAGEDVLIAGSLPPLYGSYRPDLIRSFDEIEPMYREHAEILAPYVDLLLCETMSSAAEGRAAAHAAAAVGKPVWVAWTLQDEGATRLRSGETLADAWAALNGLPVDAVLLTCCSPESISAALPELIAMGAPLAGAYANGFQPIPEKWTIRDGITALGRRQDLDPDSYARYAQDWLRAGVGIVGGCCEVGPAHIERIKALLNAAA